MKRLYYLVDEIDTVDNVSDVIHDAGITDWNFHVLSKDKAGLKSHRLHSTNAIHESDFIRSGERGAMAGVIAGTFAAVAVGLSSWFMQDVNWMALTLIVFVCTVTGAWVGGMKGISAENVKISQFHDEIEQGKYLVMIDVRKKDEARISHIMQNLVDAKSAGSDYTAINPFQKPAAHHA